MKIIFLAIFILGTCINLEAQNEYEDLGIDIFIIDSYVTPEKPHKLRITFFTSDSVLAKVMLGSEYSFEVNDEPATDHDFQTELSGMSFDSTVIPYYIVVQNKNGLYQRSESYDIALPEDNELLKAKGSNFFTICCFGGIVFGLPSPVFVVSNDKNYFGISKEIPFISFYSGGYNYPVGYISFEYAHIFEAERQNFLRLGFKYIWQTKLIEFISPGINGFTDFNGFNGLSPELSIGIVKIYNVFTLYTKYRYNLQPDFPGRNFHEVSIGLYANFFSINL